MKGLGVLQMKKKKKLNVFGLMLSLFCFLLLMWIFISFIEINLHNDITTATYAQYSNWNFFNILLSLCK